MDNKHNSERRWVAFYSQTGSEIKSLIKMGLVPDVIITDNKTSYDDNYSYFSSFGISQVKVKTKTEVYEYQSYITVNDLITLHGWLNIVPRDICDHYSVFNGHPGLITEYEELKGKDPQSRTWQVLDEYAYIGSVIHRVSPEIDGGEVIVVADQEMSGITIQSEKSLFSILSKLSLNAWEYFLYVADRVPDEDKELQYNGKMKQPLPGDNLPFYVYNTNY
jgi:folate-dependent phosphoribosylglycinamide formyltransferase PurN